MAKLTLQKMTQPVQACEMTYVLYDIESQEQLQNAYEKINVDPSAIGWILEKGGQQHFVMKKDIEENISFYDYLQEDLKADNSPKSQDFYRELEDLPEKAGESLLANTLPKGC